MNDFELSLKTSQIKLRRGWIIRILYYFQETTSREVNDRVIQSGLDDNGHRIPMPTLIADLQYLEEKGYVQMKTHDVSGVTVVKAWLTAKGKDLRERTIEGDPGVDLGESR